MKHKKTQKLKKKQFLVSDFDHKYFYLVKKERIGFAVKTLM